MFLAGEYPRDMDEESSRMKINALVQSGITVFIDLTDNTDNLLPYSYLLETATPPAISNTGRYPYRILQM